MMQYEIGMADPTGDGPALRGLVTFAAFIDLRPRRRSCPISCCEPVPATFAVSVARHLRRAGGARPPALARHHPDAGALRRRDRARRRHLRRGRLRRRLGVPPGLAPPHGEMTRARRGRLLCSPAPMGRIRSCRIAARSSSRAALATIVAAGGGPGAPRLGLGRGRGVHPLRRHPRGAPRQPARRARGRGGRRACGSCEIGQPWRNAEAGLTDDMLVPGRRADARGPPLAQPRREGDEGRARDHRRRPLRPLSRPQLSGGPRRGDRGDRPRGLPAPIALDLPGGERGASSSGWRCSWARWCRWTCGSSASGATTCALEGGAAPLAADGRLRRRPRGPDRRAALHGAGDRLRRDAALRGQDRAGRARPRPRARLGRARCPAPRGSASRLAGGLSLAIWTAR